MLHYFEKTTAETASQCKSQRVKQLHSKVCKIKSSEEIGVRYMQEWEEKAYLKNEGRKEGLEQGIKALVQTCEELGLSRDDTKSRLKVKFSLSEESLEKRLMKYWSA